MGDLEESEDEEDDDDDFSDILSGDDEDISETSVPDQDDDSGNVSLDTGATTVSTKKTEDCKIIIKLC